MYHILAVQITGPCVLRGLVVDRSNILPFAGSGWSLRLISVLSVFHFFKELVCYKYQGDHKYSTNYQMYNENIGVCRVYHRIEGLMIQGHVGPDSIKRTD